MISTQIRVIDECYELKAGTTIIYTCFVQQVNNHAVLAWEIECMRASVLQDWGLEQEHRVDWDAQYHVLPNVLNLL